MIVARWEIAPAVAVIVAVCVVKTFVVVIGIVTLAAFAGIVTNAGTCATNGLSL